MEFLEEETRPRFLLHSRSSPASDQPPPKTSILFPSLFLSLFLSTVFFAFSFYTPFEPLKSLLLWISLSLLLGPFAPSSITAGDIRVGVGKIIPDLPPPSTDPPIEKPQFPNRRSKLRRFDESGLNPVPESVSAPEKVSNPEKSSRIEAKSIRVSNEERDWTEGDVEMLKKLLTKHPVGKLKRWEVISEAFSGAHGVESVIKMAKSMGEKKMNDSDSFARFLKDRKSVDQRVEAEVKEVSSWSGGDDVALLKALKEFPKETTMRWEKITAAVPGKTKAACVKRVAELKKDFRSSKSSNES